MINFNIFAVGIVIVVVIAFTLIFSNKAPKGCDHGYTRRHPIVKVFLGSGPRPGCGPRGKEKSRLKGLGTTVAMYYTDGIRQFHPTNPQDYDIEPAILSSTSPHIASEKILPEDWQIPDSWEKFNQSHAAFAFIPAQQARYTASETVPLFIVKPGYQARKQCRPTVFEDGHVECVSKEKAIELWKKAGVWDET